MLVDDFDFHLPEDRIALRPVSPRDSARLLTVRGKDDGALGDFSFMDLPGQLRRGDVLVVISNSGSTAELQVILRHARLLGVPVIGIASRPGSLVMRHADVQLRLPAAREACHDNIAPTTSTTMQLALCDALAMAVMDMRGFSRAGMKLLHPGGAIGLRLLPGGGPWLGAICDGSGGPLLDAGLDC